MSPLPYKDGDFLYPWNGFWLHAKSVSNIDTSHWMTLFTPPNRHTPGLPIYNQWTCNGGSTSLWASVYEVHNSPY